MVQKIEEIDRSRCRQVFENAADHVARGADPVGDVLLRQPLRHQRAKVYCRRFVLPLPSRQGANFDLDKQHQARRLEYVARSYAALKGSVYELPYETAEFDLVLCFSVFEHLHQYEQGLREIARVLKPGGRFLLGMPAVAPFLPSKPVRLPVPQAAWRSQPARFCQ